MPEEKLGFKVVYSEMDHWPIRVTPREVTHKLNFSSLTYYGGIKYIVDTFVFPQSHNGPLAIFDNISNAIKFALSCGVGIDHIRIFESEYVPYDGEDKALWVKDGNEIKMYTPFNNLPEGTILAKCIKLVRLVQSEKLEKIRKPFK